MIVVAQWATTASDEGAIVTPASATRPRLGREFMLFWPAQAASAFGNAITLFAIPLIVFKLTHSAISLALAGAEQFMPWLGISSLSFDLSVDDIFGSLAAGGTLVLQGKDPVPVVGGSLG